LSGPCQTLQNSHQHQLSQQSQSLQNLQSSHSSLQSPNSPSPHLHHRSPPTSSPSQYQQSPHSPNLHSPQQPDYMNCQEGRGDGYRDIVQAHHGGQGGQSGPVQGGQEREQQEVWQDIVRQLAVS